MRRREFIAGLGGAAAWPLVARAQQAKMPVIGYLAMYASDYMIRAFQQGLQDTGYVDGKNVVIEYRWAGAEYDQLPAMAADLVRRKVALIVATGSPLPALVAKAATSTIPIVFQSGADPVGQGLVESMSRPGGNLTGITTLAAELGPKRLQYLHECVPTATAVALLINPTNPSSDGVLREVRAAALALGLEVNVFKASTERELDTVLDGIAQRHVGALMIAPDPFFTSQGGRLGTTTARRAVPTIYQGREFVDAGGLMSFGGSFTDAFRQVGIYAGRILKGEKPAELPVQQATKVELIINLKTADALGLVIPQTLLAVANEVIQ
jgi:putative ABC transport system substrate-binding protein